MERTYDLSDCIPPDIAEEIRINGKENDEQHVYRIAKRGSVSKIEFMGSYEECLYENRPFKGDLSLIGSYSTSCFLTPQYPQKFLGYLKARLFKKYPHPIIIHGYTICGLSQLTKDRIPGYSQDDHVDWWIYKGKIDEVVTAYKVYEDYGQEGTRDV